MPEQEDRFFPFGVSAATGRPLAGVPQDAIDALLDREGETRPEAIAQRERSDSAGVAFAVEGDIDAGDLSQAGWAVLFGPGTDQRIKDALQPLVDHRRAQGAAPLKVFDQDGYRPGETALEWLKRRNVRLDVVNPALGVPFYLLIVAPPEEIPFEFQYVLDLYWGVGRLWFDTPDEFRRYAESVVRYETAATVPTSRQMAVFAPRHDFDPATQLFNDQVALPLKEGRDSRPLGERQRFRLRSFLAGDASKASLDRILRGELDGGGPSLLFSGGHGMAFDAGDPRQEASQGALVCQDWERSGEIAAEHWYSAADLPKEARLHGLIHFMFACYGGAVPEHDNFDRLNKEPRRIAPHPFLSRLPQALLSHPNGGALALLAHVERSWAYSFQGDRGGSQVQGFRDVIGRLLRGERMGQATDVFNMRWAVLSTRLAELQVDLSFGAEISPRLLTQFWIARDDARNFVVLGDPAVRLRVEDMPEVA